ncbi:MAG: hypothetical protein FWE24_02855 [Defluviitaleaceae bacterium]|nr:hypothetical protein [Defluviitaleaceae bacterium]
MNQVQEGSFDMTKSELILMLKPILKLLEQDQVEAVKDIIKEVLEEATSKK